MNLFKILGDDCKPCHGGTGEWPLPVDSQPGEWLEVDGDIQVCSRGLHLVSDPLIWWQRKSRLFVAEADPVGASFDSTIKAAFGRARLLYEVTFDWPYLGMFPRVRAFLIASAKSRGEAVDVHLSEANLSGADLSGAVRSTNPPSGWSITDGRLVRDSQ